MYLAFPTGIYTCSKSIIKRERHCAKYAQCWRERHQIKCWKLSFYKYACFLLFWLLSTLWIYHFYCYSTSFLPLYLSIATLIPHIFWISTQIPSILTLICRSRISITFLTFLSLFSAFPSFRSPIPHFGLHR